MKHEAMIAHLDKEIESRTYELNTLKETRDIFTRAQAPQQLALPAPEKPKPARAEQGRAPEVGPVVTLRGRKAREDEGDGNADFDVAVMGHAVFCPTRDCRAIMLALVKAGKEDRRATLQELAAAIGKHQSLVFDALKIMRAKLEEFNLAITNARGEGYKIEAA